MKLLKKPVIYGWMSDQEKQLRLSAPDFLKELPAFSSFDAASFEIEGFFADRSRSIVCKVKDKSGEYVVKTSSESDVILAEAAALGKWKEAGANVLTVKALITSGDNSPSAIEIFDFIEGGTTDTHLDDQGLDIQALYNNLGAELARMHRVKVPGFGPISVNPEFRGKLDSFSQVISEILPEGTVEKLITAGIAEQEDLKVSHKVKEILIKDAQAGIELTLNHSDPGLHNTFGTSEVMFFDPTPEVSHPMLDLALAVIWASMIDQKPDDAMRGVIEGYRSKSSFQQEILDAAVYFQLISRYEWWLHRGKSEPHVLDWIKKTQPLLQEYKERL